MHETHTKKRRHACLPFSMQSKHTRSMAKYARYYCKF